MKLFIQEVQMDIKQGILYKYQRYVIAILLGCVLAMFYVTTCFHALDRGKISSMNFTLGDMLLYFFRGKEIYNPINGAEFMIPTEYMMLQLYLSYMIGDYILKDLLGVGKNILVRTQKRVFWWLSKCVWCVITVIGFYAAVYLSAVLICMITGGTVFAGEFIYDVKKCLLCGRGCQYRTFDRNFCGSGGYFDYYR